MKNYKLISVLLGVICAGSVVAGDAKIAVQKAVYGVPGDESRSRDVKAEVQELATGESVTLKVDDFTRGGDPAPGVRKTLHVEYTVDGEALVAEGKDWKTVFLGKPKIKIKTAVYGVLGDESRSRDVTAEVQALATSETASLKVGDLVAGGDPAPKVVKTLRVEYVVDGETLTASGTDGQSIFLGKPKLIIKKAAYGILDDPARTRDVTSKIQSLVSGEPSLSVKVGDLVAGGDPAQGEVKTLRVDYVVDGKSLTASGTDPETITLGAPAAK